LKEGLNGRNVFLAVEKLKPRGKFIYVDDDREEHELFKIALAEVCDNEVISAYDGDEGYELIEKHKNSAFLIISDINMSRINGLELKRMIENSPLLKLRAIPFIYHTSVEDPVIIKEAYSLGIQGYMIKQANFPQTVANLKHFINFWTGTAHPNYYMRNVNMDIK
jgi:CheY-like chemotaxis protein